jgi:signal transduction histidine kinase
LVKKMNGNLSIESEEGKGTTIKFSIEKIVKK